MFYKSILLEDLDEIHKQVKRSKDVWIKRSGRELQFVVVWSIPQWIRSGIFFDSIRERLPWWNYTTPLVRAGEIVEVDDFFTESRIQAGVNLAAMRIYHAELNAKDFLSRVESDFKAEKLAWEEEERLKRAAEHEAWARGMMDSLLSKYGNPEADKATLGIVGTPDARSLKSAYYRAAKKHHPDTGGNPADFIKIQSAYERLLKFYGA
jgi:hypothetical protein